MNANDGSSLSEPSFANAWMRCCWCAGERQAACSLRTDRREQGVAVVECSVVAEVAQSMMLERTDHEVEWYHMQLEEVGKMKETCHHLVKHRIGRRCHYIGPESFHTELLAEDSQSVESAVAARREGMRDCRTSW